MFNISFHEILILKCQLTDQKVASLQILHIELVLDYWFESYIIIIIIDPSSVKHETYLHCPVSLLVRGQLPCW